MYFSQASEQANGSKMTKFATVVVVHLVLGYALVHSLSTVHISLSKIVDTVMVELPQQVEPPPPPPEPPKTVKEVAPPDIPIPKVEVPVVQPPPDNTVVAHVVDTPPPAQPAPAGETTPVNSNGMRSAVFAEGCAKPDYPARAARNGESGTVILALLVGADGRVNSSKVTHSSGSKDLDRAAMSALSLCKFKPAMNNGQAEAGWAQISYVWTLDS